MLQDDEIEIHLILAWKTLPDPVGWVSTLLGLDFIWKEAFFSSLKGGPLLICMWKHDVHWNKYKALLMKPWYTTQITMYGIS